MKMIIAETKRINKFNNNYIKEEADNQDLGFNDIDDNKNEFSFEKISNSKLKRLVAKYKLNKFYYNTKSEHFFEISNISHTYI